MTIFISHLGCHCPRVPTAGLHAVAAARNIGSACIGTGAAVDRSIPGYTHVQQSMFVALSGRIGEVVGTSRPVRPFFVPRHSNASAALNHRGIVELTVRSGQLRESVLR